MKALVLKAYLKFDYTDVPMPEHGPEDVLIRVQAVSICGSDVHGYDGSSGRRQPPVIMGHEAAGIIEKAGDAVNGFKPGDAVIFDSTVYCGSCENCRRGQINLCASREVLGVSTGAYNRAGAFAEYVAVPARILYHKPETVSFEEATLVEPFSIAMHAYRISPTKIGDRVAVFGTGTIGLMVIQTLRAAGCAEIIAIDIADHKLALARQVGATATINSSRDDARAAILSLTEGKGADVCFEAVGIGATLNAAISAARDGGAVVMIGNISSKVEFNMQYVIAHELKLIGSCASSGEYETCIALLARRKVDFAPLISAVAPLSEGQQWHDRLHAAEPGLVKVVLKP